MLAGGSGKSVTDLPHAASDVAPDPSDAVALSHDVVEEHVGGPGHRRRGHGSDDGIGGEGGLELVGFEPAVEQSPRRARENLDGMHAVPTQLEEAETELCQREEMLRGPRP